MLFMKCSEDAEITQILQKLVESWDKSESRIKSAERIRTEVSEASINELRYGGRRMVDALKIMLNPEYSVDPALFKTHLIEAKECAIKAEHDAIDAIIFYVDKHLRHIEKYIDADIIHELFPEYIVVRTKLHDVSILIEESRADRRNRHDIYDEIEKNHLETIITFHRHLNISEDLMIAKAEERVKTNKNKSIINFISILAGVIGVLFAILSYFK